MKTTADGYRPLADEPTPASRREWTGRSVVRLALAVAVLSLVYYLSGLVPVSETDAGDSFLPGLALFWFLGGLVTITLMALSDRRG